jgi:hypothetical protein
MKKLLISAALAVGLGFAASANAADSGVKVGTLTCNEAGGWGFILGSSHSLKCTFAGNNGSTTRYEGDVTKVGADIGYQHSAVIIWGVFAPTSDTAPGALAGSYGGVQASAAVGVGVGANVLVGGSGNTISLQPLSVSGGTGLNVAAGIGAITLKYVPAS